MDGLAFIVAVLAGLPPTIAAITAAVVALHRLRRVEHHMNSRLDELLDSATHRAELEGAERGRQEGG